MPHRDQSKRYKMDGQEITIIFSKLDCRNEKVMHEC